MPWVLLVIALAVPILPEDIFTVIKNAWSMYGILLYFVLPSILLAFGRAQAARREVAA